MLDSGLSNEHLTDFVTDVLSTGAADSASDYVSDTVSDGLVEAVADVSLPFYPSPWWLLGLFF